MFTIYITINTGNQNHYYFFQNQYLTLKNIAKPNKSNSHRLAGIHSRQVLHSRTQKLGKMVHRLAAHYDRQAVSRRKPKNLRK